MASTHTNTNEVLAAARKDLEAQLAVVREQIARLTVEERALMPAMSALDGRNPAISSAGTTTGRAATARTGGRRGLKSSARKASSTRPRRRRGPSSQLLTGLARSASCLPRARSRARSSPLR